MSLREISTGCYNHSGLAFPDYSKPFILSTYASDTGIGAVLSQLDDNRRDWVIVYTSHTLSKPEWTYCVTRRELLAVVCFVRQFQIVSCRAGLHTAYRPWSTHLTDKFQGLGESDSPFVGKFTAVKL